jgi:hypothetical protein
VTSPDATYGELIDSAFATTGRASFAMLRCRFTDKAQAVAAVAAYRDLLDAIRTDVRYFIPLTRRPTDNALWIEPPAAPAGSMLANASDILAARARRSATSGDPAALAEPARLWRQAATYLRAAHDLLDTHRTPGFHPRTPDASLLDDARPQAAAIESLAGLLSGVAGSGQALALRAREVDSDVDCADILDPAPRLCLPKMRSTPCSRRAKCRGQAFGRGPIRARQPRRRSTGVSRPASAADTGEPWPRSCRSPA